MWMWVERDIVEDVICKPGRKPSSVGALVVDNATKVGRHPDSDIGRSTDYFEIERTVKTMPALQTNNERDILKICHE